MATYTTNYQLHQWEPEDNFLRTDFNQDFAKIDTAIKTVDTKLTNGLAQAAQNLTAGLAQRPYVVGTLAGGLQTTTNFPLGFQPAFGLVLGYQVLFVIIGTKAEYRSSNGINGSASVVLSSTGITLNHLPSTITSEQPVYYVFFKP